MSNPTTIVAFLNTGQGDSTVIILPDHTSALLMDCCQAAISADYLDLHKITTLKQVFLSHTDVDHIDGILELLQNFNHVESIRYNHDTIKFVRNNQRVKFILRQLAELTNKHGWKFEFPFAGQKWEFQDVVVDILHPDQRDKRDADLRGDSNNVSVILRITFAGHRILLTGDIEGPGWQHVIARNTDLKADVLKFPHHGAWYNPAAGQPSLPQVLGKVAPELVVISVGTNNRYNHPSTDTFRLLSKSKLRFVCTQATLQCHKTLPKGKSRACAGTVEIKISSDGMEVAPDPKTHGDTIRKFKSPKCRK
ncbi:MAG: hypothetical protein HY868_19910 [Chloroflexi bacterium]|nr:hypothetical protein [Chloroflexota bacterium]